MSRFARSTGAPRVLDVGCGTGNLCLALVQDPGIVSLCSLDIAPAHVEFANRRIDGSCVKCQVGNACALPFADATFGHTLSMLVLQFVPQADLGVREMRRVTRAGGTVAAATGDARGGFVALRMICDAAAMLDPNGHQARAAAYTRPMSRRAAPKANTAVRSTEVA